jgi:hypothetical protein
MGPACTASMKDDWCTASLLMAHPKAGGTAGDVRAEGGHIRVLRCQPHVEGDLVVVDGIDLRTVAGRVHSCHLLPKVLRKGMLQMECVLSPWLHWYSGRALGGSLSCVGTWLALSTPPKMLITLAGMATMKP